MPSRDHDRAESSTGLDSTAATPLWVRVLGIHAIGLILLFVIMHLIDGRLWSH